MQNSAQLTSSYEIQNKTRDTQTEILNGTGTNRLKRRKHAKKFSIVQLASHSTGIGTYSIRWK
jgi:hypothetical protein